MAPYYSQPLWEWLDIYFQYGVHEWLMFIGKLVGTVLRGNEEYQSEYVYTSVIYQTKQCYRSA